MDSMNEINFKKNLHNYFKQLDIESHARTFKEKGYLVLKGVLSQEHCESIYNSINFVPTKKRSQWFRSHSDNSDVADLIMSQLRGFIEMIVGSRLWDSYSFGMEYTKKANNTMEGHFDTSENPISLTFCIHSSERDAKNPICIDKTSFSNPFCSRLTISDITDIESIRVEKFDLKVGDICLFRGREHLHWRENTDSERYAAVLCHYLDYSITDDHGNSIKPEKNYTRMIPRVSKRRLRIKNYSEFKNKFSLFLKS